MLDHNTGAIDYSSFQKFHKIQKKVQKTPLEITPFIDYAFL